jgi:hypothetical protein
MAKGDIIIEETTTTTTIPEEFVQEKVKPVKVYAPDEVREATFVSDGVYEYKD